MTALARKTPDAISEPGTAPVPPPLNRRPAWKLESLTGTIGYQLHRIHARHFQGMQRLMRSFEIAPGHFRCLCIVGATPGITLNGLAEEMGVDPSRVVIITAELESRGLLDRLPSVSDRRARELYLTDSGRELAREMRKRTAAYEARFAAKLSGAEQEMLTSLLGRLSGE